MNHQPTQPETDDLPDDLPADMKRDLKALEDRRVFVPESVDAAVLRAGQAEMSRLRMAYRRRRRIWTAATSTAAAAVLLIALLVRLGSDPLPGDVTADGRVDVLDAFAVARAVKRGETLNGGDIDGDGRLSEADVRLLAARAVTLEPTAKGGGT